MKNLKKNLFFIYSITSAFIVCSQSTWVLQTSGTMQHLNSIYATDTSKVFAVGNNGTGLKTSTSGNSWQTMNFNSANTQYSIRFINSGTGFIAGAWQDILCTSNGGAAWINIGGGMTDLYDCYFTSSSSGWVVGIIEVGYGFLYNPFTYNLLQIPAIANKVLRGIYFVSTTTGWIVGDGGLIIKTTNSGTSWTQQSSGTGEQLNKVMFTDANNGIAVGSSKIILKTTNGGTSWTTIMTSSTTQSFNAVYYADAQNIWVCGDNGIILKSSDGGTTWTSETSGTIEKLNAIHGIGITDIWACGNNGAIIYRSGTTSVSNLNTSAENNIVNIFPNPHTHSFFVELNGKFSVSAELKIFTLQGELIYRSSFIRTININSENWAEGIYYYQISNWQKEFFKYGKIVKE